MNISVVVDPECVRFSYATKEGVAEAKPERAAAKRMAMRENIEMKMCTRECGGLLSSSY